MSSGVNRVAGGSSISYKNDNSGLERAIQSPNPVISKASQKKPITRHNTPKNIESASDLLNQGKFILQSIGVPAAQVKNHTQLSEKFSKNIAALKRNKSAVNELRKLNDLTGLNFGVKLFENNRASSEIGQKIRAEVYSQIPQPHKSASKNSVDAKAKPPENNGESPSLPPEASAPGAGSTAAPATPLPATPPVSTPPTSQPEPAQAPVSQATPAAGAQNSGARTPSDEEFKAVWDEGRNELNKQLAAIAGPDGKISLEEYKKASEGRQKQNLVPLDEALFTRNQDKSGAISVEAMSELTLIATVMSPNTPREYSNKLIAMVTALDVDPKDQKISLQEASKSPLFQGIVKHYETFKPKDSKVAINDFLNLRSENINKPEAPENKVQAAPANSNTPPATSSVDQSALPPVSENAKKMIDNIISRADPLKTGYVDKKLLLSIPGFDERFWKSLPNDSEGRVSSSVLYKVLASDYASIR